MVWEILLFRVGMFMWHCCGNKITLHGGSFFKDTYAVRRCKKLIKNYIYKCLNCLYQFDLRFRNYFIDIINITILIVPGILVIWLPNRAFGVANYFIDVIRYTKFYRLEYHWNFTNLINHFRLQRSLKFYQFDKPFGVSLIFYQFDNKY